MKGLGPVAYGVSGAIFAVGSKFVLIKNSKLYIFHIFFWIGVLFILIALLKLFIRYKSSDLLKEKNLRKKDYEEARKAPKTINTSSYSGQQHPGAQSHHASQAQHPAQHHQQHHNNPYHHQTAQGHQAQQQASAPCPYCGARIHLNFSFCPRCGGRLR